MRRSSSGQVLIGSATVMLVILLVMAASLPVMNTSVDPSSEAMNVMVAISETLAKRVFIEIGAAQCAQVMAFGNDRSYFAIPTVAAGAVAKADESFEARLRSLYPGAGIKNLLIEVLEADYAISLPRYGGPATISKSGKPTSYWLGDIDVSVAIGLRITYYVDKGNGRVVFKKFVYTETFKATTDTRRGGGDTFVLTNPVKDLVDAMPKWLDVAIGFIPVVGGLEQILTAKSYFKYQIGFNVWRVIEISQYDASGNRIGYAYKLFGAGPHKPDLYNWLEMRRSSDNLQIVFINRPSKSYKVYTGVTGIHVGQDNRRIVELTEYYNIDWISVALGLIGLLQIGDLAKLRKLWSRDNVTDEGLLSGFSNNINRFFPDDYDIPPPKPINPNMKMQKEYHRQNFAQLERQNLFPSQAKKAANDLMNDAIKKEEAYKKQVAIYNEWLKALDASLRVLTLESPGSPSQIGADLMQGLYQSTGGSSDFKLFSDQDPLMLLIYPRKGSGLITACLWLEDFYPRIEDEKTEGQ